MEETDVVFFINSAMNVTGRSLYSNDVRWEQTQETIESIDKHCPNNIKYIIDGSYLPIEEYKLEWLKERDRKSTRLNSSHVKRSRMPSSA